VPVTRTLMNSYALASAGGRLDYYTIVDTGTVRSSCPSPSQCVMYWSIPPNALAPSMGAGEELHKAIGIGLQYKLLRLVNGQRLLFYYFCKVVPTIPFNLLSDDDLGLADITCDIKPVGRTKEMIMTLQHLTSTTGSVCRKVSGLHILREEPINLDQLRSDIADRADALQRQAARHFNIDTAKLRCVSSIVGNDFAAHGQHTSITVDGAVLLTRVGDSSDTTPSTPATTASSVPARLPMRHMKAIFGYPSSKTITSLARLVDAKIDHSSDKHRSATNETANARPKGLKPTHRISKTSSRRVRIKSLITWANGTVQMCTATSTSLATSTWPLTFGRTLSTRARKPPMPSRG
jgi:hypothetical protein